MADKPSVERRLWAVDRRAARLLIGVLVAGLAAALLFAGQALLIARVVDRVFIGQQALEAVLPLLGAIVGVVSVRAGLLGANEWIAQRAAARIKARLRARFTARLTARGPAYTRGERSGELVNSAMAGVEALDAYVTRFIPARTLAAVVPALIFLLVLIIDPLTTLVLLFAGPILILLLVLIGGRTRELTEQRFADMSWMSAHFLDMLQGLATLKEFGRSKEQSGTIAAISRRFGNTTMEVLTTAFQTSLVLEWAATAATALVALEVGVRLIADTIIFEEALAVLLLTPEFFLPLRQLSLSYHAGAEGKAAAKRIFGVLDGGDLTEESGQDAPVRGPIRPTKGSIAAPSLAAPPSLNLSLGEGGKYHYHRDLSPAIRFEGVHLAYDHGRRPALRGVDVEIPAGRITALVGPTGAGKSSAAALLLRFLAPDRGRILVDGIPLAQIDPDAWRVRLAWVPQHPHLFHGTVAENIRLAQPEATADDVARAARDAGAHDFIRRLPRGYDTPLGEHGSRLSGGQRQRIAIARAFLKDAPLVILDEATAHLDTETENAVRAALARLLHGRTALIIAHRLRLAYDAHQIVLLDQGRVVATGVHEELLQTAPAYRSLVAAYEGVPV